MAALTEVDITVSNYRLKDAFCTVNRRRRSLRILTPLLGDCTAPESVVSAEKYTQRQGE